MEFLQALFVGGEVNLATVTLEDKKCGNFFCILGLKTLIYISLQEVRKY